MLRRSVLSLALAAAFPAWAQHGVSLDLGLVAPRYTPSPDGQWWQKDQDSSGQYKPSGAFTVGLSFDLNPAWTAGIHYIDLGRPRVDALAVAFPNDNRADLISGTDVFRGECSAQFTSGCAYQWHTQSHIKGLEFDFAHRLFDLGPVRFDAKVGLFAYRLRQTAIVEPLGCRDNCPWRVKLDQNGEGLSPTWGAVARWKWVYFEWSFKERIGDHMPVTANVKGRVETKILGARITF